MTSLSQSERTWQLGGLFGEDGNLERPADPAMWPVEVVERRGELLVPGTGWQRMTRAGRGMLEGFARLADDETGDRIAAYARRWGFLDLCEHGLPASHNPQPRRLPLPQPWTFCSPTWLEDGEPLDGWRYWAGQARAVLDVHVRHTAGEPGADEDWRLLYAWSTYEAPWWEERSAKSERWRLRGIVNDWTVLGNVRPWLVDYEPWLVVGGGTLFGALAVQLALLVSGSDGVYRCSACGSPFVPEGRRPAAGRRRYCASCRERRRPGRDAKRDHRARMTTAR